jgi:iron complex transport system ATP-binding protein
MPFLEIRRLCFGYGERSVLNRVSLQVESGQRWAIIGKNGTGKSTLVKTVAGLLRPVAGRVLVDGRDVAAYSAVHRARTIAYVPQKPEGTIPYTVYDFVMLGRYARLGLFGMPREEDKAAVAEAIDMCDVSSLRQRMMSTLSGGELQRVLLAGALAQNTPLLLLDEPTTFLDPAHERLFLRALELAQKTRSITTLMVTHDINTALTSCTHVLALLDGRALYAGCAGDFSGRCPGILQTVFGIPFSRYHDDGADTEIFGTWRAGDS